MRSRRIATYGSGSSALIILLTASIVIEAVKAGCLQNSVSAYYYTPVRAIFIGAMFAIGLSLIVHKGRGSAEDFFLNLAGMLAPVVAVAPTTDVGLCYSLAPNPLPLNGGSLADWVASNIYNNMRALLIVGAVGLIAAFIIWLATRSDPKRTAENERGVLGVLVATAVALLVAWLLVSYWDDFNTGAHGPAAVLMFVCLAAAICFNAWHERGTRRKALTRTYVAIAGLMAAGILIPAFRMFDEHVVFALEAYEITLFTVYWLVQTAENWDEKVALPAGPEPASP